MKRFSKMIVLGAMPAFLAGALGAAAEPASPATQPATQPAAQAATQAATQPAALAQQAATRPDGSLVLPDGTNLQNPGPSVPRRSGGAVGGARF